MRSLEVALVFVLINSGDCYIDFCLQDLVRGVFHVFSSFPMRSTYCSKFITNYYKCREVQDCKFCFRPKYIFFRIASCENHQTYLPTTPNSSWTLPHKSGPQHPNPTGNRPLRSRIIGTAETNQRATEHSMSPSDGLPSVEDVHASSDVLYSMGNRTVVGMGPDLVVKYGDRVRLSEAEAMEYIARNTDIPVPKVLKAFEQAGRTYIYMTRISGQTLDSRLDNLSDAQVERIVEQVAGYVTEMRNLGENDYIGSTTRGPCTDYFWQYNDQLPTGPFDNEAQFNDLIISAYHDRWGETRPKFHTFLRSLYRDNHRILFTHGDLAPRNIMVSDDGRITGIIDWEYAGWYPEYWEYVKAHFGGDWRTNWILWVDKYFPCYHYELLVHNIAYRALT